MVNILANSDRQLEERLNWLRNLTQEDRDFIAKYGEQRWRQFKAMQEFKSIEVSESAKLKESTQQRKQRLLDRIEKDIAHEEARMEVEKKKLEDATGFDYELLEAWAYSGFWTVMGQIWDLMIANMNSESSGTHYFALDWEIVSEDEKGNAVVKLTMNDIVEARKRDLEKVKTQTENS